MSTQRHYVHVSSGDEPSTPLGPCPTCGGGMQWKQNRTSKNYFMGCLQWPTCNGTRDENGVDTRISAAKQNRMWTFLKAAVLNSEDDCLTFSERDLAAADGYELHLDEVVEARSFVLTVRKKL